MLSRRGSTQSGGEKGRTMSVSRGLVLSIGLALALAPLASNRASAQVYETARRALGLYPDPTARSPRLLGMGRLTLADDKHNSVGMWDFAANPTGVLDADSSSTFDLRPATAAAAGVWSPEGSGQQRQYLAGRDVRLGYEGWRRTENGNAYGVVGEAATLRTDRPYDDDSSLRATFSEPKVTAILNGKMPFFRAEQTRYAFLGSYTSERQVDEYRTFFANENGQYLGKEGDIEPPPEFFTPEEYRISTLGASLGLSYAIAPWSTTALVGHVRSSRIEGENSSVIHDSGTGEDRPHYAIQVTEMGRLANNRLEWIYDFYTWSGAGEGRWVFTLKAGLNQEPFSGRGKLLDREENGLSGRGRVRFNSGNLMLSGSFDHGTRTIEVTPPDITDETSFNHFLNVAYNRDGADSLALPDSVVFDHQEDTYWSVAGGGTWKLSKGIVGVEYHLGEQKRIQSGIGEGPKRQYWDVRAGVEYPCTRVLSGRAGYLYRVDDRDLLTNFNEYTSNSLTLGLGLAHPGSIWGLDIGYLFEWLEPDYQPVGDPHDSRHMMSAQIHWAF